MKGWSREIARFAAAILFVSCAGQTVAGQSTTPRERLLAKVMFRYRGQKTLTQSVTGKFTVRSEGIAVPIDIAWDVSLAQPNRFRIETKVAALGREKHGLVVSDGKTVWDWNEDDKQYSQQPLTAIAKNSDAFTDWLMDRAVGDLTLMLFLEQAGGKIFGVPSGTEKAMEKVIQVKNFPTRVVEGQPMYILPVPFNESGNRGSATLYVDTKDLLVRRCRYDATVRESKRGAAQKLQVNVVLFYNKITPSAELPESIFAWTPPDDAKQVKAVVTAFDRVFE